MVADASLRRAAPQSTEDEPIVTELPPPPIAADVDLTDFQFMPLDVARLRRSKAWLICKRRPELAFYMMNLWTGVLA